VRRIALFLRHTHVSERKLDTLNCTKATNGSVYRYCTVCKPIRRVKTNRGTSEVLMRKAVYNAPGYSGAWSIPLRIRRWTPQTSCRRNKFAFIRSSIVLRVQSCHLYSRRCVTYNIHGSVSRVYGVRDTSAKCSIVHASREKYSNNCETRKENDLGDILARARCVTGDHERHAVDAPNETFHCISTPSSARGKSRRHPSHSCHSISRDEKCLRN